MPRLHYSLSHHLWSTLVKKIHSQEIFHIGLSECSAFWWISRENPCCELISSGNDVILLPGRRGKSIRRPSKCSRVRIINSGRSVHLISFERYFDFFLAYCSYPFYSPEFRGYIVPKRTCRYTCFRLFE